MYPGTEVPGGGPTSKERLGQILKRMNLVTEKEILEALTLQRNAGGKIGEILIRMGCVSHDEVDIALSLQVGGIVLKEEPINPDDSTSPERQ